jgi:hypothetical protein
MSQKLCPFGFYSFYVNKQVAQAGGCHHCVEERCALWDSYYDEQGNIQGQCALMSVTESLRTISEASMGKSLPVAGVGSSNTGSLSVALDKLKARRARRDAAKTSATPATAPTSATPATAPPSPPPTAPIPTVVAATPTAATPTAATPVAPTPVTPTPAEAPKAAPPVIPIVAVVNDEIAASLVAKPLEVEATVPVVQENKPPEEKTTTETDFEDLFKPPSIPISELPVISVSTDSRRLPEQIVETTQPTTESSLVTAPPPPPPPPAAVEVTPGGQDE